MLPTPAQSALKALSERRLRLRGARSAPARYDRIRGSGAAARHAQAQGPARGRLYRPGAYAGRRRATAHPGAQRGGQGCGIAGATARRDRSLPASRDRRPAAREAADARPAAPIRRCAGRAQGAGGGRRRAQYLCAQQRARTPRHDGAFGRHRARSDSKRSNPRRIWPSC